MFWLIKMEMFFAIATDSGSNEIMDSGRTGFLQPPPTKPGELFNSIPAIIVLRLWIDNNIQDSEPWKGRSIAACRGAGQLVVAIEAVVAEGVVADQITGTGHASLSDIV